MKKQSNTKGMLEALLVIGLILIIPLFFVMKSAAEQNAVSNTPAAILPTVANAPTLPTAVNAPADNAMKPKQPPACTFPLAQTTTAETTPEEYTFSEPQVVLTASANLGIVEWLPDNQRVLIMRDIPAENQQSIELFDPQTGETQVYAVRKGTQLQGSPVWIENLKAVLYPETFPLSLSYDNNKKLQYPITMKRLLWLSRGNPANVQSIEDSQVTVYIDRQPTVGANFAVIAKPDGSQFIYSDGVSKQIYQRKTSLDGLGTAQSLPFDLTQRDYRRPNNTLQPVSFKMIWRPGATHVFLYSGPNFGNYTFLSDVVSGQICELNLFGEEYPSNWQQSWAITANWSPDGRYLAIVRTKGKEFNFSDLIILDTTSGELYPIDAKKLSHRDINVQGKYFIGDVTWAPDNRHLAVIGQVNYYSSGSDSLQVINRLYLVDFIADQAIQISSQEIKSNIGETSLLWSEDGAQLLVKCPTDQEGRLCLINVQKKVEN